MANKIKFWIKNARDIALPQSMLPALTAYVLCVGQTGFCWWTGLLAVVGVAVAHLGMNLADDYFDYRRDSRIRSTLSKKSVRARLDKCSYITSGATTIEQTGRVVALFLAVAAALGAVCAVTQFCRQGWQQALAIGIYALLGLILGVEYGGKPLKLSFHGLGELVIGVMFGVLNMLGIQAACTGIVFSWPMLLMGVGIGAMVTNIVYVHSCMEMDADGELDKMTFARLLKNKTAVLAFLGVFTLTPFVCLVVGIAMQWWSAWYLFTLLTLPMSVYLIISTARFVLGKPTNDNPRWWMGPMGDWAAYKKAGMDWFLIRWLLARNIVTLFCLIIILVQIILLCV